MKGAASNIGSGGAGVAYFIVADDLPNWEAAIESMKGIRISVQNKILTNAVQPALGRIAEAAKRNVMALGTTGQHHRGVRDAIKSRISVKIDKMSKKRSWFRGRAAVWYGSPRAQLKTRRESKSKAEMASLAHLFEFGYDLTHFFGYRIKTRRIQARPFMHPAFTANRGAAQAMFRQAVADGVAQHAKGGK